MRKGGVGLALRLPRIFYADNDNDNASAPESSTTSSLGDRDVVLHDPANQGHESEMLATTSQSTCEVAQVDEQAIQGYELWLPFTQRSCTLCLKTGAGNHAHLSRQDEERHLRNVHGSVNVTAKCTQCRRAFASAQGVLSHLPKCKGQVNQPTESDVVCSICGLTFKKRGIATHMNAKHPAAANTARAERNARAEVPTGPGRGSATSIFSEEEIAIMLETEVRYHGDKFIAKRMEGILVGRTAKQLRDKRGTLVYKRRREEYLAAHLPAVAPSNNEVATSVVNQDLTTEEQPEQPQGLPADVLSAGDPSGNISPQPVNLTPESPQAEISAAPLLAEVSAQETTDAPTFDQEVTSWRREIIESVLAEKLSVKAKISRVSEVTINTLRDALRDLDREPNRKESLQAYIDIVYDKVTSHFGITNERQEGSRHPRAPRSKRAKHRQFEYAKTQDLFKKDPGLLAKHVRDGTDWVYQGRPCDKLKVEDVRELYNKLWGAKPDIQLPEATVREVDGRAHSVSDVLPPITGKEVQARLRRTKKSVAAGLDGIKAGNLNQTADREVLRLLFNLVMVTGTQPTQWRMNRTMLLPKEGKDPSLAENYRPITIASLLSRLYFGILDERLRRVVQFTPRQKGFVNEAGCFNNVQICNELLRHSKQNAKDLVAVLLDVSKAFDTVPHQAIGAALKRKGLPDHVVRIVEDSYTNICTLMSVAGESLRLELQRGVKQGDPLSPLLFNAVFEPLLLELESQSGYDINSDVSVSCLAFADDILLTTGSVTQARILLRKVEQYLYRLGMTVSAPKSACFHIKPIKESWLLTDPGLEMANGERVPMANAGTCLSYLGAKMSPWAGIDIRELRESLPSVWRRVMRQKLKPHQKVELITRFLVPHYLYQLVLASPSTLALRQLDQDLRVVIKQIYHLPQATANGLIYCGKRDGGLGIPRFEVLVTSAALKAGIKLGANKDPVLQALAPGSGLVKRLERIARGARMTWPVSIKEVDKYKHRAKKQELEQWASLGSQGKSVNALADDKIANAWLQDTTLLKPHRMITALKMRTNSCADRAAMSRAKLGTGDLSCRRCGSQKETLGHILGQCVSTKPDRIRRHDDICKVVMERVIEIKGLEAAVTREPSFSIPSGGNLKPDLVIQNQGRVFVVDVTVRHEDGEYLAAGRQSKFDKYNQLLPLLVERLGVTSGEVLPIVVGTRGAMPRETVNCLAVLGITDRKTRLTISMLAHRSSIELYHRFMDYDH